jgi:hypothetical protein
MNQEIVSRCVLERDPILVPRRSARQRDVRLRVLDVTQSR